jgi:hypothetical protein
VVHSTYLAEMLLLTVATPFSSETLQWVSFIFKPIHGEKLHITPLSVSLIFIDVVASHNWGLDRKTEVIAGKIGGERPCLNMTISRTKWPLWTGEGSPHSMVGRVAGLE